MLNFKHWMELDYYGGQKQKTPLDTLKSIASSHPDPDNLACTFTAINKVGINPKSNHTTPVGIYLYPISYVIEMQMRVPWAGGSPYVSICEFTNPHTIMHMNPVQGSDLNAQKGLEFIPPDILEETSKTYGSMITSDYSILWYAGLVFANRNAIKWGAYTTKWNSFFREKGIDGFYDHNTGTIYNLEPTQCVVFHKGALKVIHTIEKG